MGLSFPCRLGKVCPLHAIRNLDDNEDRCYMEAWVEKRMSYTEIVEMKHIGDFRDIHPRRKKGGRYVWEGIEIA